MKAKPTGPLSRDARGAWAALCEHMGEGCTVTGTAWQIVSGSDLHRQTVPFWRGIRELEAREIVRVIPTERRGVFTFVWLRSPVYKAAQRSVRRLIRDALAWGHK